MTSDRPHRMRLLARGGVRGARRGSGHAVRPRDRPAPRRGDPQRDRCRRPGCRRDGHRSAAARSPAAGRRRHRRRSPRLRSTADAACKSEGAGPGSRATRPRRRVRRPSRYCSSNSRTCRTSTRTSATRPATTSSRSPPATPNGWPRASAGLHIAPAVVGLRSSRPWPTTRTATICSTRCGQSSRPVLGPGHTFRTGPGGRTSDTLERARRSLVNPA